MAAPADMPAAASADPLMPRNIAGSWKKRWRRYGDHRPRTFIARSRTRRSCRTGWSAGATRSMALSRFSASSLRFEVALGRGRGRHRGHRQQRRRRADLATFVKRDGRGESANGSGDRLCPGDSRLVDQDPWPTLRRPMDMIRQLIDELVPSLAAMVIRRRRRRI